DDVVSQLAAAGRWDLVEDAASRGFAVNGPAPTALHRAAAGGLIALIDTLLAAGADPSIKDPQFNATPSEWAAFFSHPDVAESLGPDGLLDAGRGRDQ